MSMSWLSSIASYVPGFGSSQAQVPPVASNTPNSAAITVEMSPQRQETADRINQLAPSEIASSNALNINFNGTTQHLVVALTYNGHRAPLERAKLEHLTKATQAVFELTHEALKQEKQAIENELGKKRASKKKVTVKEVKELDKLKGKLAILNNISSFSFLQKGSQPYLKVISKDPNQEPLWIHLDSDIFGDIHKLAQRNVENEVHRLQALFETDGLEQADVRKLDVMKYYLESRNYISLESPPQIIRHADGRCFIQFERENGDIEPIEIDSKLHPHVGAKHLQIDEFFNNFIEACNAIVENDKKFAKKVGITNQQQQQTVEQQKQLAAAQQQQALLQAQTTAANNQAAQPQSQAVS